jgi:hypothetical protein
VLYIMLLWASRRAILARNPTPLSRAIEFLTEDYTVTSFWWEPFEMCRKLALSIAAGIRTATFCLFSRLTGIRIPSLGSRMGFAHQGRIGAGASSGGASCQRRVRCPDSLHQALQEVSTSQKTHGRASWMQCVRRPRISCVVRLSATGLKMAFS